jgi:radical SAM superfamily enzyme YgiQ (UPF0313 family)
MGIESGDDVILAHINKGVTAEEIIENFRFRSHSKHFVFIHTTKGAPIMGAPDGPDFRSNNA